MKNTYFSRPLDAESPIPACTGLIHIAKSSPKLLSRLCQKHSSREQQTLPGFAYHRIFDHLDSFRRYFQSHCQHKEPIFVWLSHPNSHTKINPSYIIARGFSPLHLLFLETLHVSRSLPALLQEHRRVSAIVLDGFMPDRVLLQLARQWVHAPLGQAWVKADELDDLRSTKANRLFLIHSPARRNSL